MIILPSAPKAEAFFAQRTWALGCEQEAFGLSPSEQTLANRIHAVLLRHYPGHPWGVSVKDHQGVVLIRNPALRTEKNQPLCMVVHLHELGADPALKVVIKRAGEMLERWGQRRAGLVLADIAEQRPNRADITPPRRRASQV